MNKLKLLYYKLIFNKKNIIDIPITYQPTDISYYIKNYCPALLRDNPKVPEIINASCKKMNVNPRIIITFLATLLDGTNDNTSVEEVNTKLGFDKVHHIVTKIDAYIRLAAKKNEYKNNMFVSLEDHKPFKVKNESTMIVYRLLPFLGVKKYRVYERECDKEGNITKVEKIVKYDPPFGAFKYWLKDKEIHE